MQITDRITITNEDNMQLMARYPDNYFDLAIVDPPYGIGIDGQKLNNTNKNPKHNRKAHDFKGWDNSIPNEKYFKELFRVSKNQIIWGANHFIEKIPINSSCWIVWDKVNGDGDFADCELAWTSFKTAVRKFTYYFGHENSERIHPTQKPKALYKWILKRYAKPGDRILDTHLGSGSSAIAAFDGGFDFVGCEIDADYYTAAKRRFEYHRMQLKLL